jgi:putative transposase
MVEELLAARGILVSHETVRQWALKFGQEFANQIRGRLPLASDKWHLDEVVLKIAGVTHWLWRAVDQAGSCSTFSFSADATCKRPNAYFASW